MEKIIETERLILRHLTPSDAESFYQLNIDPEVMRYTGDAPFETVEEAQGFLASYKDYEVNGFGRWAVILKESKTFIGWCGLKLNEESLIDLGFRFFKKEWGKGYATEAALASLGYGFNTLNIKEVIGRAASENVASIRVLEKVGMKYWKKDDCKGIEDSVYYKLSREEFIS